MIFLFVKFFFHLQSEFFLFLFFVFWIRSLSFALSIRELSKRRHNQKHQPLLLSPLTVGDLLPADREEQLRERPGADGGQQRRHERRDEGLDEVGEGSADDERDGDVDDLACLSEVGVWVWGSKKESEREGV